MNTYAKPQEKGGQGATAPKITTLIPLLFHRDRSPNLVILTTCIHTSIADSILLTHNLNSIFALKTQNLQIRSRWIAALFPA